MPDYPMLQQRIRAQPSTWLVTGVAGCIGSNLLESLEGDIRTPGDRAEAGGAR